MDFTTCHIFLLNIYHDYEEEGLSIQNFEKILRYLESYFVRCWLAGVPTRALGIVFNNLYKQVKDKNPYDLVSGLREVLISFEGNQIWPDDNEFRRVIINESVYNSRSSTANERVKLLLESIEASLSKERVKPELLTILTAREDENPCAKARRMKSERLVLTSRTQLSYQHPDSFAIGHMLRPGKGFQHLQLKLINADNNLLSSDSGRIIF